MTKWPAKFVILGVALTLLALATSDILKYHQGVTHFEQGGPFFRFSPLMVTQEADTSSTSTSAPSSSASMSQPPISSFGFLYDLWPLAPITSFLNGSAVTICYRGEIQWNGIFWVLGAEPTHHAILTEPGGMTSATTQQFKQQNRVIEFQIEESRDGQEWTVLETESCKNRGCPAEGAGGPLGGIVRLDYRPPWDKLASIFMHIVPAIAVLLGFISMFWSAPVLTRRLIYWSLVYHSFFYFAINVFGKHEEAACNVSTPACAAVFCGLTSEWVIAYMISRELFYFLKFNIWVWWGTGWMIYHGTRLIEDDFGLVRIATLLLIGVAPLTVGSWGYFQRLRVLWEASSLVKGDQEKYNRLYEKLLEEQGDELTALAEEVADSRRRLVQAPPGLDDQIRHLMPSKPDIKPEGGGEFSRLPSAASAHSQETGETTPASMSALHPSSLRLLSFANSGHVTPEFVKSLDQMYNQAVMLDFYMRKKVQQWAERSRGMFPSHSSGFHGGGLISWTEAQEDLSLLGEIRFGKLKSPSRAIEKALRCYKNDVSRVVDICRQSIGFESVSALRDCLHHVVIDPEVGVRRLVNRLDPKYDAASTSGYRDVKVNLIIRNRATETLGLDRHVCEVQLITREFYENKTAEGHQRYVQLRNMRSE